MKSILFRVVEPMMFRGASEFAPTSRGPQAGAWSMPLPPPSTLAGALATLVLEYTGRNPPVGDPSKWYEEVVDILGGNPLLRGPFLDKQGNIYLQYKKGIVAFRELLEILRNGGLCESTERLSKAAKEHTLSYVNAVGITIKDETKTTLTGLIYSAAMVDYSKLGKRVGPGARILLEVHRTTEPLQKTLQKPKIIRLGGEGRLIQVLANEAHPLTEQLNTLKQETNTLRLYVASPMLFEATPKLLTKEKTKLDNTQSLTHTLKHKLDEQLNMPTLKADSIKIEGTTGILGGFSLAKPARKPIYATLQPGSIIELTRSAPYTTQEYHELYTEGLGLFRNIGYGTVIPIPLENAK